MNTQKRPNEIPIVLVEMASAFIAGSMSKTIVAPLERVKLILQNQPLIHVPEKYKYKGIMDALRSNTSIIIETKLVGIPVDQGFFSFWRGNGTNILRIIPSSIIRFSSYETINRMFVPHKGLRQNVSIFNLFFFQNLFELVSAHFPIHSSLAYIFLEIQHCSP